MKTDFIFQWKKWFFAKKITNKHNLSKVINNTPETPSELVV